MANPYIYKYSVFKGMCEKTCNSIIYTENNTLDTVSLLHCRSVYIVSAVNFVKAMITAITGLAPTDINSHNYLVANDYKGKWSSLKEVKTLFGLRNKIAHCSAYPDVILGLEPKEMGEIVDLVRYLLKLCDETHSASNVEGVSVDFIDLDTETSCTTFVTVNSNSKVDNDMLKIKEMPKSVTPNQFDRKSKAVIGKAFKELIEAEGKAVNKTSIRTFILREGSAILADKETAVDIIKKERVASEEIDIFVAYVKKVYGDSQTWKDATGNNDFEKAMHIARYLSS